MKTIHNIELVENPYLLDGKYALQMDFSLKPGVIKQLKGIEDVDELPFVMAVAQRYYIGDEIKKTGDVRQRLCEIAAIARDKEDVIRNYNTIVSALSAKNECGDEMLVEMVNPSVLV